MQEQSRYAVGIDVGTTMIRCVVGHVDTTTGTPTIVHLLYQVQNIYADRWKEILRKMARVQSEDKIAIV